MSKEVLAVDMDEVLFPLLEGFLEQHNPKYGTSHGLNDFLSYDFEHALDIPVDEAVRRVYEYLAGDHALVQAVAGSQEAIARLAERYDLVVVTARDQRFEQSTLNWAHNRYEKVFKHIVCVGHVPVMEKPVAKSEVCASIGAVALIDDSLAHVSHCGENGIDGILFGDYPWNQSDKLSERVTRCENWDKVLSHFGV